VDIGCAAQSGGIPYHMRFLAHVRDGVFQGQYGTEGTNPFLTLEGTIGPDGHAVLLATGTTGDSRFSIRNAPRGFHYSYHVDAQFQEKAGAGRRVENRPCDITFIKR
jgi:hypothetical protein